MTEVAFIRCSVESLLSSVAGDGAGSCVGWALDAMRYGDGWNQLERVDDSGDLVTMDIMAAPRFDV